MKEISINEVETFIELYASGKEKRQILNCLINLNSDFIIGTNLLEREKITLFKESMNKYTLEELQKRLA